MSSRNVLNAQEVDRFVDDLAQQTARPELERWLGGSARRWILKHYDLTDRIVRDPATGGLARTPSTTSCRGPISARRRTGARRPSSGATR
jgi:hypothetical protein